MPDDISILIDAYYYARENRLEADRISARLKQHENDAKRVLIAALEQAHVDGAISPETHRLASLKPGFAVRLQSWDDFTAHLAETHEWELLQHRVNETAVRERWARSVVIPGVTPFPIVELSLTKA